jgi:hypothetical protein
MNVNLYTIKGDPQELLAVWQRETAGFAKDDYFLNVVSATDDGISVVDVCPTEADFQGWINGDDWRRVKAEMGGDVEVTPLGEVRTAVAREGLVELVSPHAHSH